MSSDFTVTWQIPGCVVRNVSFKSALCICQRCGSNCG
jgi:hypothetical protein